MRATLDLLSSLSILFPAIASVTSLRHQQEKALRILTLFFIISTFTEVYAVTTTHLKINNMPGLHVYTLVEGVFFLLFYYHLIRPRKKLFLYAMAGFILLCVCYSLFSANIRHFPHLSRTVMGLLITASSLYYFYHMLDSEAYVSLKYYPYFYINVAALLYYMGNMFLFMLNNMFTDNIYGNLSNFQVHSIINIISNMLYCTGFLWTFRNRA